MALLGEIHAVIFDMDGLLFDTEALCRDAIIFAAEEGGYDIPLSFIHGTIGLSGEATRKVYNERYGQQLDFDIFWAAVLKRFYELAESQLRLKEGVVELLDALDASGVPRAIATSSRHEDVQHHLAAHHLVNRFQAIVARGDYARGKPNPDPFLKAAERLGVKPEFCVALEDSYNGVRAATSAGMMTIMVPDLLAATDEMEDLCMGIGKDLHAVLEMLNA